MFLKYRSWENENEFQKPGRGFSPNKPIYKNLFHFIHRCHIFGEPNASLSPRFQQFGQIFRAKVDLTRQVTAKQENFPSPTPKEKDELVENGSSRNPKTQRINQLLRQVYEMEISEREKRKKMLH